MASEDGLAYVKGQWIEVDRKKLSEALAHWKQVEAGAADRAISFIEGMRLLAGAPADLDADGSTARRAAWSGPLLTPANGFPAFWQICAIPLG